LEFLWFTADITPRERSRIIALTQTIPEQPLQKLCKEGFDLQKDLMHAGVHISSRTVRHRLLEAGRKAEKPLKTQILTEKRRQILEWAKNVSTELQKTGKSVVFR